RSEEAHASRGEERREDAAPAEGRAHAAMRALGVSRAHGMRAVVLVQREVHGAVDEPEVRERLRKIAEEIARGGIDLLRIEADIVRAGEEALEESPRRRVLALGEERVDVPEAAAEEGALAARATILCRITL